MSNLNSFLTHASNVETDILTASGTPGVGNYLITSSTPTISEIALNSGKLELDSGFSWLLECHLSIYSSSNCTAGIQFYNDTTTSYVGQIAYVGRNASGVETILRQSRKVSRALILASDFGANSTMVIAPKVVSISGSISAWNLAGYTNPVLKIVKIS